MAFVATEVVQNHDADERERQDKNPLDIGAEYVAVYCAIEDSRGVDPIMAKCGDEGGCVPVTEGRGTRNPTRKRLIPYGFEAYSGCAQCRSSLARLSRASANFFTRIRTVLPRIFSIAWKICKGLRAINRAVLRQGKPC